MMIKDILLHKFQNINLIELTGGYTNSTFLLEGTSPLVVAKVSKQDSMDGKIEINSLTLLHDTTITPKIHDFFESDEYLITIMDYIPGINGQKYLDSNDSIKTQEIYKLLGKYLAQDIHSKKRKDFNTELPTINKLNVDLESLDFLPRTLINEVKSALDISIDEEYVLVHGDYGPHNAISLNNTLSIIDWEWSGWGNSLQDISWVIWFLHLHYPPLAKELSIIFLNSYRSYSNIRITEELYRAYSISRIINIMDRISHTNIDVQKEWIRRLQWTLSTKGEFTWLK